jgi:hypothetical protein
MLCGGKSLFRSALSAALGGRRLRLCRPVCVVAKPTELAADFAWPKHGWLGRSPEEEDAAERQSLSAHQAAEP